MGGVHPNQPNPICVANDDDVDILTCESPQFLHVRAESRAIRERRDPLDPPITVHYSLTPYPQPNP